MARFRLIPREEKFYSDFMKMADQLRAGARMLDEMLATDPPKHDKANDIKEVEHKCDFLTHEIIQRLNRTFVTPIDREDIHAIARSLDDVMDAIDATAALFPLYKIETCREEARELTRIICASTDALRLAVETLENPKGTMEHVVEVNRLENEADRVHQRAVGKLFEDERDPVTIIKWKEIFDLLEGATDRCEDVANLVENVLVKHG